MPYIALDRTAAQVIPTSGQGAPETSVGMTLVEYRDELNAMLAGRPDVLPARLTKYVNFGYTDLVTSLDFEVMKGSLSFPLVAGQMLYKLPNEVYTTTGLAIIDPDFTEPEYGGRPLIKTTLQDFRRMPNRTAEFPERFFKYGKDLLVVYPEPENAHTVVLDFRIRPDPLVDDTDSTYLGTEWDEGILLAARYKMFNALLMTDMAQLAENDLIKWVRKREDTAVTEDTGRISTATPIRSAKQLYRSGRGGIEEEGDW